MEAWVDYATGDERCDHHGRTRGRCPWHADHEADQGAKGAGARVMAVTGRGGVIRLAGIGPVAQYDDLGPGCVRLR